MVLVASPAGEELIILSVDFTASVQKFWDKVLQSTDLGNFDLIFEDDVLDPCQDISVYPNLTEDSTVIAAKIPNLAWRKPARQSSNYVGSNVGKPEHNNLRPASNAVDGDNEDDDGGSSRVHVCQHTCNDDQAWWEVDLGTMCNIAEVRVYSRSGCMSRIWPSWILLSAERMPEGLATLEMAKQIACASHRLTEASSSQDNPRYMPVELRAEARYVRVQLEGTENLHMTQVEVYRSGEAP